MDLKRPSGTRTGDGSRFVSRVIAAVAGGLFLLIAILMIAGFGALQTYPLWLRLTIAGVIALYGIMRLRGALRSSGGAGEN